MKYIVTVRGILKSSPEQAKLVHNEIVTKTSALKKVWEMSAITPI